MNECWAFRAPDANDIWLRDLWSGEMWTLWLFGIHWQDNHQKMIWSISISIFLNYLSLTYRVRVSCFAILKQIPHRSSVWTKYIFVCICFWLYSRVFHSYPFPFDWILNDFHFISTLSKSITSCVFVKACKLNEAIEIGYLMNIGSLLNWYGQPMFEFRLNRKR